MHFRANIIVSVFACAMLSSSVLASPTPIEPVLTPIIAAKNNMGGTDTLGYESQGQNRNTDLADAETNAGVSTTNSQQLFLVVVPIVAGLSSLVL
ncbi:hypothetical protein VKT23_001388 [Stygiomarasmius scandens]|uniref:Uncharacterized protein n=1 Tax=Marasmiellus scandens TaxID=2682957 RepID=A0ABR1K7Y7_9AGAR